MPYTISHTNGALICSLQPQTSNTTAASIVLIGQGLLNYGQFLNNNLVSMVENFSDTNPPRSAFNGQLWFNPTSNLLSLFDASNAWHSLATQQWATNNFVQMSSATETTPTVFTALTFLGRFTAAEQTAIANVATTNGTVLLWMIQVAAAQTLDLTNSQTIAGVNALVTAGLITQARATAILTPSITPP